MHKTPTRERIKLIKSSGRLAEVPEELKTKARLEDCEPWIMHKIKAGKPYDYWMASWREGDKTRNVHLGSCKKLDKFSAKCLAIEKKSAALGVKAASYKPIKQKIVIHNMVMSVGRGVVDE